MSAPSSGSLRIVERAAGIQRTRAGLQAL